MGERLSRWRLIGRLLRAAGWPVAPAVALNLAVGVLPIAFIVAVGVQLHRLPDLTALAVATAAFAAQQILAPFQAAAGEAITRRVDGGCVSAVLRRAFTDLPPAVLERGDVRDRLSDVRAGFDGTLPTPGAAAAGAVALVARYAQLAGAVTCVTVVLGWWPGAVLAAIALVIRFGQRGSLGRFAALWDSLSGQRRRVLYLRDLAAGPAAAKEIRLLGLRGWLTGRHAAATGDYLRPLWTGRRRLLGSPFAGHAAAGLAGAGLVLAALAAGAGRLSLAELGIAVQAVLIPMRFGVYFPEADVQTQFGVNAQRAVDGLPAAAAPGTGRAAGPVREGIRFEGVCFAYPGGPPVLDGLDLELPAGTSTAIVGLNGAGKTTLVKLLAGIHHPDRGRITADGTDLSTLDTAGWRRQLAVVFQDFLRLERSARDNVALAATGLAHDTAALRAAAARAGALDLIDALPSGWDTVLSAAYDGGQDLSGGQWQRLALARAYLAVHAGAGVLVLDEPTAQLDARAEVDFYDRFLATTAGLTTLVISHRFATVRRAQRIAVLDGGRVAELGSHDELLAAGGRYARMFTLQAQRFTP